MSTDFSKARSLDVRNAEPDVAKLAAALAQVDGYDLMTLRSYGEDGAATAPHSWGYLMAAARLIGIIESTPLTAQEIADALA